MGVIDTGIALGHEDLQRNVRVLTSDKRDLEGTVNDLRGQEASDQQLLDLAARSIVDEQLDGQRVVVLSAPGSDGPAREELLPLLEEAGATVVGTVELRSDLFDPDRAAELDALVTRTTAPRPLRVERAPTAVTRSQCRAAGASLRSR